MSFSADKLLRSFGHAAAGFRAFLRTEQNAWLHLVATTGVVSAGVLLHLAPWEWVAVILSIGLVFNAELLNTAIERLCDHVTPGRHEAIKAVKDLAAAAVVVAALAALVVALIVFGPKIIALM